jgi:hypothetical protein
MTGTGYLVVVHYDEHERVDHFVHKNEADAEHEAEVQRESINVVSVDVEPVEIFLGEDDEWHIER